MAPGMILSLLAEGQRKEVARSPQVAEMAIGRPDMLPHLIECLWSQQPTVVSHAAHALMTISMDHCTLLAPHTSRLLEAYELEQWEIKEQIAKILPKLRLTEAQAARFLDALRHTLKHHKSGIARTCALQGVVEMAKVNPAFGEAALAALVFASEQGSKALQARARKLAAMLE